MKKYRISPREGGKYYAIEWSNDGKTWTSTGDSAPTAEEAQVKADNFSKGLTAQGLTKEEAAEQAKAADGPSLTNASPESKSVITKEEAIKMGINIDELPTEFELNHPNVTKSKKTDENGWIDSDGNIHLNSKATEARTKAAEEDRANGANYKTAKAPSAAEMQMRTGKFDEKDINGNYATTNEELLRIRQTARDTNDKELEQKVQAEINRRYSEGSAPEFNPNPEKPAKEEETVEEPKQEVKQEEIEELETPENVDFRVGEQVNLTPQEQNELEKNKIKKDSYWKNLIYGNGIGSTKDKDAKEEKETKYNEFLKDNPSLIKSIFGKNSGLNIGERAIRLGELLASIGADTVKGAYAGYNRQSLPDATEGRYAKIYNEALTGQYGRKQEEFASEQEAKNTAAKNKAIIDANPVLKDLPEDIRTTLADNLITGLTYDEVADLLKGTPYEGNTEAIYNSFNNAQKNNVSVTTQQGNVLTNEAKKLDNNFKAIDNSLKTAKDCNEYIAVINEKINDLQKFKLQLADANQDQYFQYIERYLGYLTGVQTVATNAQSHQDANWNTSAEVRGGIPVVSGRVSGGGGSNWGTAEGENEFIDALKAANIPVAEQGAADWTAHREEYIKALEEQIDEQIQYWKDAKAAAEARAKVLTKSADANVNDGIIKAPHMQQWIEREDGTKIELNPDDTIYATKNEITSENDDGSEIIPVEQDDKVVVIQNKLGYEGSPINKDFEYYLNKLRG